MKTHPIYWLAPFAMAIALLFSALNNLRHFKEISILQSDVRRLQIITENQQEQIDQARRQYLPTVMWMSSLERKISINDFFTSQRLKKLEKIHAASHQR